MPKSLHERIEAVKPKCSEKAENFMLVKFHYIELIVPYIQGMKLVESLKYAEEFNKDDYSNPKITPLPSEKLSVSIMSKTDYDLYKMSGLLGVTYRNLKDEMARTPEDRLKDEEEDGTNE